MASRVWLVSFPDALLHSQDDSDALEMARYHATPTRATANSAPNSQKYSLYLPLHPKVHRKSSISKYDEKARRDRESVVSRGSTEPGKRRATMRSKEHDDEEEQLQRAIEESKRDTEGVGSGKRTGKRSRDDSEE